MFPVSRHLLPGLALGLFCAFASVAKPVEIGSTADNQARYIATHFPGRMAGSPAEMLAADYLLQQFNRWGYQSNIRQLNTRYLYTPAHGLQTWQNVTANTVIAARAGKEPQQIIIMAHLDTYAPVNDKDVDNNLGGIALQGIDDNASGIGVMLELAERLRDVPLRYGIRFIATSSKLPAAAGAMSVVERMSEEERKNTLLVIDLDSLIVGDTLFFSSSASTPTPVRKLSRDRAISLARQFGIPVAISHDIPLLSTKKTDFYQEADIFDRAGIPVLMVTARHPGAAPDQQRAKSKAFPDGSARHSASRDNIQYLDKWLPGQIKKRTHDVTRIMLPLVKSLVQAGHQDK